MRHELSCEDSKIKTAKRQTPLGVRISPACALHIKETLTGRSEDLHGKTECITTPPRPFLLSLTNSNLHLSCVLLRTFQSKFAHTRTVVLIPLKLQFMTDGRGHIHSEQSWCRWTVCMRVAASMSVPVCVGLLLCSQDDSIVTLKTRKLPNVGAVTSCGSFSISMKGSF